MEIDDKLHTLIRAGFTAAELSEIIDKPLSELKEYATYFGLSFGKTKSHGEDLIVDIIAEKFPYLVTVVNYNIGRALSVDVYIESIKIGFEYDGEQHFKKIEFFYKTDEAFIRAVNNDVIKDKLCKKLGIKLVRIEWFLSEEEVKDRVISSILETI